MKTQAIIIRGVDREIWKKFKIRCIQEGKGAAEKIIEMIEEKTK